MLVILLANQLQAAVVNSEIEVLTEPGSTIFIDGQYFGNTNNVGLFRSVLELEGGNERTLYIQIRIEKDGFRSYERTLAVNPGNYTRYVEAFLSRPSQSTILFNKLYVVYFGLILFIIVLYLGGKKAYPILEKKLERKNEKGSMPDSELFQDTNSKDKTVKFVNKTNPAAGKINNIEEGEFFDKYQIISRIAQGGVAIIYEALVNGNERLALKVMSQYLQDEDMVNKFIGEGWALQEIKKRYPGAPVVNVFDYGRKNGDQNGVPFIAMELVDGQSLGFFIKNNVLSYSQKIEILRQLAIAMDAAHKCKVLHRDLSPDNVLLKDSSSLEIRLIDFGVARHEVHWLKGTSVGAAFGKPEYMAPEQIEGGELDFRVDYYSFGVLAFALFMGKPPFQNEVMYKVFDMHINSPIPKMSEDIPENIRKLVKKLMAKKPASRPKSIEEILKNLN